MPTKKKPRAKTTARKAAKKSGKKPKAGAKKKAVKKKAAKPKAKKRVAARPKAAAKTRAAAKPAVKKAAPARAATAPKAPPPPQHDMREEIEVTLFRRDIDTATPALVDVLTAVGKGYGSGPAAPPPGVAIDVNTPIADALVGRYEQGSREPGRRMHRPQVLATVGFNLDQLGLGSTGEDAREVLTSLCLGSWNPDTGTHAELDGTASFVVRFYRDGL